MTDKCNTINPSGNDVILNLSTRNIKDELKRLIKHWKKEAECHLLYDDTGDIATTLIYEKCAEDLEKTLLWY